MSLNYEMDILVSVSWCHSEQEVPNVAKGGGLTYVFVRDLIF